MHRDVEIVRVNSIYSNNPSNIEDTGHNSWNINVTSQYANVIGTEGDLTNFQVRGDKQEVTDGTAWLISGNYSSGGIAHAHTTTANDTGSTSIYGTIRYSSLFDIGSHPPTVLTADAGSLVAHPADDSQLGAIAPPCAPSIESISEDRGLPGDFTTNDSAIEISGTWNEGTGNLQVTLDSATYGIGSGLSSDGMGNWLLDLTLAPPLEEGTYLAEVTLQESVGGLKSASQELQLT